jgi:hypothetical protein
MFYFAVLQYETRKIWFLTCRKAKCVGAKTKSKQVEKDVPRCCKSASDSICTAVR